MKSVLAVLLFMLVVMGGVAAVPRAELLHAVATAKDFVDALVDGIRPGMERVAERAERVFGRVEERIEGPAQSVVDRAPRSRARVPESAERLAAQGRDRTRRTMPRVYRSGRVSGAARVIDGDTLVVGSKRIRLFGIDALESDQRCRAAGRSWPCGREATRALAGRIDGSTIACDERTRDDYGRVVAVCRRGGADLNRWMVAQGWALAYRRYSQDYVAAERTARSSRRGMWRGEFVPPWEWRRG